MALQERSLAVCEVKSPQPTEFERRPKSPDFGFVRVQVLRPTSQCLRVVGPDVFEVEDPQICGAGQRRADRCHRGYASPRKDHPPDEVLVSFGALEASIVDHNCLKNGEPMIREQTRACLQELVVMPPVDRLDHLDGNQFVESSSQIAPVVTQDGDAIGKTRFGHLLRGVVALGVGDGCRGHATAIVRGCMNSQRAPSGTDLDEVVVGLQAELSCTTGRSWTIAHRAAKDQVARRARRNRSSSRRASARRIRWTGRSEPAHCAGQRLARVRGASPADRATVPRGGRGRPRRNAYALSGETVPVPGWSSRRRPTTRPHTSFRAPLSLSAAEHRRRGGRARPRGGQIPVSHPLSATSIRNLDDPAVAVGLGCDEPAAQDRPEPRRRASKRCAVEQFAF